MEQGDIEDEICCPISDAPLPSWVKRVASSGDLSTKLTCYINMQRCPCGATQSKTAASNKSTRTTTAAVVAEAYLHGGHETGGELLRAALAKLAPGHAAPPPVAAVTAVTATKEKRPRDDDDGDADARRIEALGRRRRRARRS